MIYLPHRRNAFRSGPSFAPTDLAGCKLWLKADAGATSDAGSGTGTSHTGTACADNTGLYYWADQSGNNNDFVQTTEASRPTYYTSTHTQNGKPSTYYNLARWLTSTSFSVASGAKTLFAVYDATIDLYQATNILDSQTGRLIFTARTTNNVVGWYDNVTGYVDTSSAPIQGIQLVTWKLGTGTNNGVVYRNGSSLGAATYYATAIGGTSAIGARYSGTNNGFKGYLYELVLYDTALGSTDLSTVETYLRSASRWNF
jgi:hypothetical protein